MNWLHLRLIEKQGLYAKWHNWSNHNITHWFILIFISFLSGLYLFNSINVTAFDNQASNSTFVENGIKIKDLSGQDLFARPFVISRVFKQGEIVQYPQAVVSDIALLTQANVKSRWGDGSVKHVLIAFQTDLVENNWTNVSFINQASCNCDVGLSMEDMLSADYNLDAKISLTPGGSASAKEMLQNGDFRYWIKGPIATQIILEDRSQALKYDLTFQGYKSFHPIFVATFFPSNKRVKTEFIGENNWINSQQDIVYNLALTLNGNTVYSKNNFDHSANMRWRKVFWTPNEYGKTQIDYNLKYLVVSKVIPNYDMTLVMPSTAINDWINTRPTSQCSQPSWSEAVVSGLVDIGEPAQLCPYMPAPGGRPDIGYLPGWYTAYLFGMGADDVNSSKLFDMMIGNGEASASIRMHFRENLINRTYFRNSEENAFGHFISMDARPTAVLKPNQTQSDAADGDQIIRVGAVNGTNGITPEVPHWPGLSYLPYVITGDYFFLEELWASASYVIGDTAEWDGYRIRNKTVNGLTASTEFRGEAWALREIAQAAFISPDDTIEKSYFTKIFENNIAVREGMANMIDGNFYNPNCSTSPFDRTKETNAWCYGKNIIALHHTKNVYMQDNPMNLMEPGSDLDGGSYSVGYNTATTKGSTAMWMWAYHWVTLGHAAEMGLPSKSYLNNRLKFLIHILIHPDAIPQLVASYTIPTRNGQDKMLRTAINNNYSNASDPQHGYANVIKAAASYLPGLSADGLTGDAAWIFLNTALRPYSSVLAIDQTWAIVPRQNANIPSVPNSDTIPPIISITKPINGSKIKGKILQISAIASDNVAVSNIQLLVDSIVIKNCPSTTSCSINMKTNTITTGNHTITAIAKDTATPPNISQNAISFSK
jgi:hypothetical protein